jgi:uncharacterized membrane protein
VKASSSKSLLRSGAALVIALGIFFRLYHLDYKAFSEDEATTLMHVIGLTEAEAVRQAANFRHVYDLEAALHPSVGLRSCKQTIDTLRLEDPQHPPLYYLIARQWIGLVGNSRVDLRLLSAVIGILALPCMGWLCLELFGSTDAALAGAALLAASPVEVLYSQEVREYGLWLVFILITCALLLRALRTESRATWALYGIACALGLYTYTVAILVMGAHAAVVLHSRTSRRNLAYAFGAMLAGVALYLPWVAICLTGLDQINKGMATINHAQVAVAGSAKMLAAMFRTSVLDLNGTHEPIKALSSLPILGFVAYILFDLRRSRSKNGPLLIWTLAACTTLPFLFADLWLGGARISATRYFIPLFVALDLATVALIARWLSGSGEPVSIGRRFAFVAVIGLLFAAKLGSCMLSANAETWWSKDNIRSLEVAAVVNRSPHAILISDNYVGWIFATAEYLEPQTDVALRPRCYLCAPRPAAPVDLRLLRDDPAIRDAFALGPSKSLQAQITETIAAVQPDVKYRCIDIRDNCLSPVALYR